MLFMVVVVLVFVVALVVLVVVLLLLVVVVVVVVVVMMLVVFVVVFVVVVVVVVVVLLVVVVEMWVIVNWFLTVMLIGTEACVNRTSGCVLHVINVEWKPKAKSQKLIYELRNNIDASLTSVIFVIGI